MKRCELISDYNTNGLMFLILAYKLVDQTGNIVWAKEFVL